MPLTDVHCTAIGKTRRHAIKIDVLPDDAFLRIFDFCVLDRYYAFNWWHPLVHVCRRWRQIIFASPRRLNLQLHCRGTTPVREKLHYWPVLPLAIVGAVPCDPIDQDNFVAAFEHRDRVRTVFCGLTTLQIETLATVMQGPFPALTYLQLGNLRAPGLSVLPDGFLDGSASCLQEITLNGIYFPALPTLLSSASNLVDLHLRDMSSTIILPEAMATGLAAAKRLQYLTLEFHLPDSPHRRLVTPPTRAVLPSLTGFRFLGEFEYLEDLVARMDCPRLEFIDVSYFPQLVSIYVPQFLQFIDRAEDLKLAPFRCADADFGDQEVYFNLDSSRMPEPHSSHLAVKFSCCWYSQLQPIKRFLEQLSGMFSTLRHLAVDVFHGVPSSCHMDDVGSLDLFRRFSAVETLHVGGHLTMLVDRVLDDLVGTNMDAEVMPALRVLYLDGRRPTRLVRRFITARKLSGHPVTIVNTREELERHEALVDG